MYGRWCYTCCISVVYFRVVRMSLLLSASTRIYWRFYPHRPSGQGHAVVTAVIRCAVHWAVYDVVYYILCIICDVVIFALFFSSLPFRSSDPWLHSTPLPPGHNVRGYIAARGEHAFIAAARRAVFQRYMPSSTRVAARGAHEFIAVARTAVFQRYIPSSTLVELCVH